MSEGGFPDTAGQVHEDFNAWLEARAERDRDLERDLTRHTRRSDAPLLLSAADGGAAGLAAWLARQHGERRQRLFFHHVGATRDSRRREDLILRLLRFLKRLEGFREPIPVPPEARDEVLPNWLARAAARERLVLVITAIDSLESLDEVAALEWIPAFLPAPVRLIIGARSDAAARVAAARGYVVVQGGGPDAPRAADLPPALATALWASRYGLDGDELRRLGCEAPEGDEPCLFRAEGRWLLAGPDVQDAVRRLHLPDGAQRQDAHHQLAQRCFASGASPARQLGELPWQLAESGDRRGLAELLCRPDYLRHWLEPGWREELAGYWRTLDDPDGVARGYAQSAASWPADRARLQTLEQLLAALQEAGATGDALAPLFRRGLDMAEALPGGETLAFRIGHAAWLAERDENSADAEPTLDALLAEAEGALGADAAETRRARHALATRHEHAGDLQAAAGLYRRSLRAREEALGSPRHLELIPHLTNLAAVLKAAGDFDGARPLYQRALGIAERRYGNAHPTTAACLDNLAGLLYAGQDFAAAEDCYQRALGIAEQAFGPAHPATAASAHNLGTVMDAREQFRAAEQLFRRALEIRREVYGEDHMDTASSLHNLAGALDVMGRHDEAEPMYRRAVETWEKVVGREHPATATSVNNLADLLREKGAFDEAEALYQRNLETWTRLLGEGHAHSVMTLAELAGLHADRGDEARAEPLLRQAVEQTARVMGVDNMQHVNAVTRLAALLRGRGRVEEARELLRQTSRQVEGKVGLFSPALQKLQRHLEALDANPDRLH